MGGPDVQKSPINIVCYCMTYYKAVRVGEGAGGETEREKREWRTCACACVHACASILLLAVEKAVAHRTHTVANKISLSRSISLTQEVEKVVLEVRRRKLGLV